MDKRCHVSDEIHLNLAEKFSNDYEKLRQESIRDEIRRNLCGDLQTYKYSDENYYCIFHLPNKDKNVEEFRESSGSIITKIQIQIAKIHELPDEKKQLEKANIKYDFRYVRFPCHFGFRGQKVEVEADFSHSTFFEAADFMNTEFLGYANFDSVKFHKLAYFILAKFQADAYFYSAEFISKADFRYTFFSNGKFTKAIFSEKADFESSEIVKDANFIEVTFIKKVNFQYSKLFIANFENAKFLNSANFRLVEFLNYVFFKGNNENLVFGNETILDLQDARIEKPERVTFHTVRLSPNWFVNVDSRKFIFIDIHFADFEGREINGNSIQLNVKSEINCLNLERRIANPEKLLKIACRQLVENAESNNRFEEASDFRQMAFETEWLEKKEKFSNLIKNLIPESEKLKRRFGGSTREEDKPNPPTNSFGIIRRSGDFVIHWLYRITSFYGESWERAFIWFVLICPVFALLLHLFGSFEKNSLQTAGDFLAYSLQVMTLQRPEPKPDGFWTVLIYSIEIVFTPIQLALLALAIRRKFMR